jgi:hypothetical protein
MITLDGGYKIQHNKLHKFNSKPHKAKTHDGKIIDLKSQKKRKRGEIVY